MPSTRSFYFKPTKQVTSFSCFQVGSLSLIGNTEPIGSNAGITGTIYKV